MSHGASTPGHVLDHTLSLLRSPYAGELAASEPLSMLLLSEGDYIALQAYENAAPHPVLLSYAQHYRLLEDLAQRALQHMPWLQHVLVRFHTVYLGAIPGGLMDARVLLVDDPCQAADALAAAGAGDVLVLDDRLRRDTKEQGDNSVHVSLRTTQPLALARQALSDWLQASDLHRGTADHAPTAAAVSPMTTTA